MSLTGVKFCKSPVPDTKKQINRPTMLEQPVRLLTTATSTMNQSKNMDYPFVHLTGHKLVDGHCISSNFEISSFSKNASLKSYSQFPMLSISQLVGGFVGSKSQFRTNNRESHQIWDIVLQKLEEFINCRPIDTEKYSNYYELSALPQDIIGSFYKKTNSTLSYILREGCQSFKTPENINKVAESSLVSHNSVEKLPPSVDTYVSRDSFVPSHSTCNKPPVPVFLEIVEHFISQPNSTQQTTSVPTSKLPEKGSVDQNSLVVANLSAEPSVICETPFKASLNLDSCQGKSSRAPLEGKQSYAEVTKMAQIKPKSRPAIDGPISFSKKHRIDKNKNMSRNCQDSRQRYINSSNCRGQRVSSEQQGKKWKTTKQSSERRVNLAWISDPNFKNVPTRISQHHRQQDHEGLRHFKNFRTSSLKRVPEMTPNNTSKEIVHGTKSLCYGFPTADEVSRSRPSSNLDNRKSCTSWRCRQHLKKSSLKRDMKCVVEDNAIEEIVDDQSVPFDVTQMSTDRSVRLNTLGNYIAITLNNSHTSCNSLENSQNCDSKIEVQSLPIISKSVDCTVSSDDSDLTRLSESSNGCAVGSPRSSSESLKVPRSRSISEESKASSTSTSSLNSYKLKFDANFRRRFSSECDSDDSFVVFEDGMDCSDYDLDSDSEISEDDEEENSDLESEDECDSCSPRVSVVICIPLQGKDVEKSIPTQSPKMEEVNKRWERNCSSELKESSYKKVQFAAGPGLQTVHRMVKWDFAYRAARCGPWEEMARDRDRFRQRVERSEPVLASILRADHRDEVYTRLRDDGRHDIALKSAHGDAGATAAPSLKV